MFTRWSTRKDNEFTFPGEWHFSRLRFVSKAIDSASLSLYFFFCLSFFPLPLSKVRPYCIDRFYLARFAYPRNFLLTNNDKFRARYPRQIRTRQVAAPSKIRRPSYCIESLPRARRHSPERKLRLTSGDGPGCVRNIMCCLFCIVYNEYRSTRLQEAGWI